MQHRCNFCSLQFETDKVLQKHASSFHQQQDAGRAQPILPVVFEKIKIDPELIILDEDSNEDSNEVSNRDTSHLIQKQPPKRSSNERVAPQIVRRSQQECRYQCDVCSKQFHLLRYFKKHLTISENQTINKCQEHYGMSNNNIYMPAHTKSFTIKSAIAKPNQTTNEEQELQSKCNESQDGPKTLHSKVQIWKNSEKTPFLVEFGVGRKKFKHGQSLIITKQNSRATFKNNGKSQENGKLYYQNISKPSIENVEVQIPVLETKEMSPAAQITTCKECRLTCASFKYLCIHYANEHKLPAVALSHLDTPTINQKLKEIIYNNCTQTGFKCGTCHQTFWSQFRLREHTSTGLCYIHHSPDDQEKSTRTEFPKNEKEKSKFVEDVSITNNTARCLTMLYNLRKTTLSKYQMKKSKLLPDVGRCATRQVSKRKFSSRTILKRDAQRNRVKTVQKSEKTTPNLLTPTSNQGNRTECHSCNICKQEFSKPLHLKRHKVSAHQVNSLECDICQKKFTQKGHLEIHELGIHKRVRYACNLCQKTFADKKYVKSHKLSIHKGLRYKCELCPKKFIMSSNLKQHKQTAHNGFRYKCDLCVKEFTSSKYLKQHKLVGHGGVRFKCELCVKEYTALATLKQHKLSEHDDLRHQCDICQKRFNYKSSLKQHKLDEHSGFRFKCELCVKEFTSSKRLQQHNSVVHGGVRFKCELCVKEYSALSTLKQHKWSEHDGLGHQCDICQKCFTFKSTLKRHKLVEHGGLRFKCELCSKEFTSSHWLKQHKLSKHDGVRHKCDICQHVFAFENALKQHKLVAHSSFRFKCEVCSKEFTTSRWLKQHKLWAHDGVRHKCDICQHTFAFKSKLKHHKLVAHSSFRFKCEICQKEFLSSQGLRDHKRSKHGVCHKTWDMCQKQFPTPRDLGQHELTEHGSADETSKESQETTEMTASKQEISPHEKLIN